MVLAGVVVALVPETSLRRPGAVASLRPRVAMPAHLRADIVPVVPAMIATWALAGMYLSLGPSVSAGLLGLDNHLIGGVVVTLLAGTGALAVFLLRSRSASWLLAPSSAMLGLGALMSLAGVAERLVWLSAAVPRRAALPVPVPGVERRAGRGDHARVPRGLPRGGAGPGRGRLAGRDGPGAQGRLLREDGRGTAARSHHFPVEAPEGTAKLLAGVRASRDTGSSHHALRREAGPSAPVTRVLW
jgi:hypothetical protein